MKLTHFLSFFVWLSCTSLFGQDTLYFKNQSKVMAKIFEINPTQLKYKRVDNPDGPVYITLKSELNYVVYSTGLKETFANSQPQENSVATNNTSTSNNNNENSEYGKTGTTTSGMIDAKRYYNPIAGPAATGVITVLCTPLCGLIPAVIIGNNEPDQENLDMPRPETKTTEYKLGYTNQASKIKRTKTWQAYGIGSAVWIVAMIIIGVMGQ